MLIGKGELEEQIRAKVRAQNLSDKVRFIGNRFDVERYYQAFDCFVFPSTFEGLPGSVAEAQASGLKCLVSDCVTREVKITDLVKFLPLEKESWVEELAGSRIERERGWMDEWFERADYSMEASCRKLLRLYESV